eukprot:Nitzschia sp. Nitz4//scaffold128_size63911//51509//52504//NITZ4_006230-RA/size63911-processed-gene-0.121-mRNA-1//1//CDS//3329534865//6949//frame0
MQRLLASSTARLSCRRIIPQVRKLATLPEILAQLQAGQLTVEQAEQQIRGTSSPDQILQSYATLDHTRSSRAGFPEAVFGQGKTPSQLAHILDDMARHVNEQLEQAPGDVDDSQRAILATRVTPEQYEEIQSYPFQHGSIEYKETACIIEMTASGWKNQPPPTRAFSRRVVVATAGTTDLPVAEEAAVVLEAAQCEVVRITDVGVAGLYRILRALPRLQDPEVGCVIVCAGMDGALPSVVAGLVKVPVIACPTSVGYGVSLGGISAMLTMLNSCAPGVGVVNIDNGFGAAALAYKCIRSNANDQP